MPLARVKNWCSTDCALQTKKIAGTNFKYFRNVCSINPNGNYINLDTLQKEWHSSRKSLECTVPTEN